ncbi:MAG: YaaR family protein [Turneriella sp.]|nr:YaaR family protein [Leptospiraceae bacterium]MCX7633252.1 YaaR family protein [Turneriella sp.]
MRPAARRTGARATGTSGFAALVAGIARRPEKERPKTIEELFAELSADEEQLSREPTRGHFERYRSTVKKLCEQLVHRSYRLHGWEDRRKRRYEILKTIDAHLAQLYAGLLRRNQDVVIVLHLMGQIRGLILDLKA